MAVSGAGFAPGQSGDVLGVRHDHDTGMVGDCVAIGSFETDADGNFGPVPATVEQSYQSTGGTQVDCLPDNNCVVVTTLDPAVVAPITFSPFG